MNRLREELNTSKALLRSSQPSPHSPYPLTRMYITVRSGCLRLPVNMTKSWVCEGTAAGGLRFQLSESALRTSPPAAMQRLSRLEMSWGLGNLGKQFFRVNGPNSQMPQLMWYFHFSCSPPKCCGSSTPCSAPPAGLDPISCATGFLWQPWLAGFHVQTMMWFYYSYPSVIAEGFLSHGRVCLQGDKRTHACRAKSGRKRGFNKCHDGKLLFQMAWHTHESSTWKRHGVIVLICFQRPVSFSKGRSTKQVFLSNM